MGGLYARSAKTKCNCSSIAKRSKYPSSHRSNWLHNQNDNLSSLMPRSRKRIYKDATEPFFGVGSPDRTMKIGKIKRLHFGTRRVCICRTLTVNQSKRNVRTATKKYSRGAIQTESQSGFAHAVGRKQYRR